MQNCLIDLCDCSLGTLAWDDEFYRIYFGMTIKIWQARRYAVLRCVGNYVISCISLCQLSASHCEQAGCATGLPPDEI
jgi:hypothetical protein